MRYEDLREGVAYACRHNNTTDKMFWRGEPLGKHWDGSPATHMHKSSGQARRVRLSDIRSNWEAFSHARGGIAPLTAECVMQLGELLGEEADLEVHARPNTLRVELVLGAQELRQLLACLRGEGEEGSALHHLMSGGEE